MTQEDRERVARTIKTGLAARAIDDEFDRGWQAAIDRVARFLIEDLAGEPDAT